jgi:predicted phage terminase large subunit-like protein
MYIMPKNPNKFSEGQLFEWEDLCEDVEVLDKNYIAKTKFLGYVKHMWPDFIESKHHEIMADKFDRIVSGKLKRLIINMPPRHTKSEFASVFLPSFFIGHNPKAKLMEATHTSTLAIGFGRRVRDIIRSMEYRELFPGTSMSADSTAGGLWHTSQGGSYKACSVMSNIAGFGADLFVVDDPHSEKHAFSPQTLDDHYEWYQKGPIQRLQPGAAIVIVMTRWGKRDLTARVLDRMLEQYADKWEIVKLPAVLPSGRLLWPGWFSEDEVRTKKAELTTSMWNAQYMQDPTSEEGALIKREWWKRWEDGAIPRIQYTLQSYDTAYLSNESADYSAITTWGIFKPVEDSDEVALILMDAKKGRWEFPDLKRIASEEYNYWKPDIVIIENKASGAPLTQELRMSNIPVMNFNPARGRDKVARVNAVSPMFESGMVWAPDKIFADEVIEECAEFPYGEYDDYVDSMTQAVLRFRQGGFIQHPEDEDDIPAMSKRAREYY